MQGLKGWSGLTSPTISSAEWQLELGVPQRSLQKGDPQHGAGFQFLHPLASGLFERKPKTPTRARPLPLNQKTCERQTPTTFPG